MPPTKPDSAANRLLAALPHRDRQRFLARCEAVESGLVGGTWTLLGLGKPASGTRKGNDAIPTSDTDRKPTAFLGLVFRSLAQNRANVRAVAHIVHLSDPVAGASVTVPSRRTPSISAISSRVMVSSFEGKHPRLGTAGGAAAGR